MLEYFLSVFSGASYGIFHMILFKQEFVFLLNSCMWIETQYQTMGKINEATMPKYSKCLTPESNVLGSVHRYFLAIGALVHVTLLAVPIAFFLTSFFAPCLPPSLSSTILNCKFWNDTGDAGIVLRIVMALVGGHAWSVAVDIVGFGMYTMMFYPVQVILLHIKKLERFEMRTLVG